MNEIIETIHKSTNPVNDIVSSPLDQETSIEFKYTEEGSWHSCYVTCRKFNEILNSGMFEGRTISSAKLMTVTDPDNIDKIGSCNFIYDFLRAKQGLTPWRMAT